MKPQPRTTTIVAWGLWLATLGCCAGGLLVTLALTRPSTFAGLVWSLAIPGDTWVAQLVAEHRPLPLTAQLAAVSGEFNWAPATVLGVTLPALVVPDGRLHSRRWRAVAVAAVVAAVLVVLGSGLAPARLEDTSIANPFGLAGPAGSVAATLAATGTLLWMATMVASLLCVVVRFRSSAGVERQQLRWVAAGAAAAVAGLLGGAAVPQRTVLSSILYAMVLCIPLAVAVAVLRYRLWDLDRLISRTVTYTLVTALLVVPYLLILPAATRLAQGSGSLAVAAVTLAAAAAFQPARRPIRGCRGSTAADICSSNPTPRTTAARLLAILICRPRPSGSPRWSADSTISKLTRG